NTRRGDSVAQSPTDPPNAARSSRLSTDFAKPLTSRDRTVMLVIQIFVQRRANAVGHRARGLGSHSRCAAVWWVVQESAMQQAAVMLEGEVRELVRRRGIDP